MKTLSIESPCHRGDPSLYTSRSPAWKIDRETSGAARGLPVRSLPSQTRDGFYAHKALGSLESGKATGPVKLLPGSAKPLSVGSATHLKK